MSTPDLMTTAESLNLRVEAWTSTARRFICPCGGRAYLYATAGAFLCCACGSNGEAADLVALVEAHVPHVPQAPRPTTRPMGARVVDLKQKAQRLFAVVDLDEANDLVRSWASVQQIPSKLTDGAIQAAAAAELSRRNGGEVDHE